MEHEDEVLNLEQGNDRRALQQFLALGGAPAFMNRAARVQETWNAVLAVCRARRAEWLQMVSWRLAALRALAGDWQHLQAWLDDHDLMCLQTMYNALQPRLKAPINPTNSPRVLLRALEALHHSIHRFNQRWLSFVRQLDLGPVNEARDKYNRYYVLEKECIVGSPILARREFRPLPPRSVDDVLEKFPLLPTYTIRQ